MFVFKLSWLPWIMIIGGFAIAIEGDPSALILVVLGAIWLVVRYKNQAQKTSNPSKSIPGPVAPAAPQRNAVHLPDDGQPRRNVVASARFCPYCGKQTQKDFLFCENCGSKLNP